MRQWQWAIYWVACVFGAQVYAQENLEQFNNLTGAANINPAQIKQFLKSTVQLNFDHLNGKATYGDANYNVNASTLSLLPYYHDQARHFIAGIRLDSQSGSAKGDDVDVTKDFLLVTPQFAYQSGNLTVALAYAFADLNTDDATYDDPYYNDLNYLTLGAILDGGDFEWGVAFRTSAKDEDKVVITEGGKSAESQEVEYIPGQVSLHAKTRFSPDIRLMAAILYSLYNSGDDTDPVNQDHDTFDSLSILAGGEYMVNPRMKFDAYLKRAGAAECNYPHYCNTTNNFMIELDLTRPVSSKFYFGALLAYLAGSKSYDYKDDNDVSYKFEKKSTFSTIGAFLGSQF